MPIEDFYSLTDHVAVTTDEWTSIGGIALKNYSMVVDTSRTRSDGKIIRQKVEDYYNLPVEYLIITHRHQDHTSGRHAFKVLQIICSDRMPETIFRDFNTLTINEESDFTVEDGEYKVKIVYTGGHTVDSIIVHFLNDNILFAGDLVFENFFPPYAADPSCNPEIWINALECIKKQKPDKIVPGHGPVIDGKGIDNHISNLKNLRLAIRNALKDNIKPGNIEVSNYHGEFIQHWFRGAITKWYQFYRIIDSLPVILEEMETQSREQKTLSLSKLTTKDLDVLGVFLKIIVKGNKNSKIKMILDFIEKS